MRVNWRPRRAPKFWRSDNAHGENRRGRSRDAPRRLMGLPSRAARRSLVEETAGAKVTCDPGHWVPPAPYLLIGFDTPARRVGDDEPPAVVVALSACHFSGTQGVRCLGFLCGPTRPAYALVAQTARTGPIRHRFVAFSVSRLTGSIANADVTD